MFIKYCEKYEMITSGRSCKRSSHFEIALLTYTHNPVNCLNQLLTQMSRRIITAKVLCDYLFYEKCYHFKWTQTNIFLAALNEHKLFVSVWSCLVRIELRNELENWLGTWCPKICLQSSQRYCSQFNLQPYQHWCHILRNSK